MHFTAACRVSGVLVILTAAPARADIADYLDKPVAAVRLTIEGRASEDQKLASLLVTRAGRQLTMLDVRESVTHLFSTGRFEDVQVNAETTAAGVALTYELMPIHPIDRMFFTGSIRAPGVDQDRLRRAVTDRYGASPPAGRADDIARLLEAELRLRGYLHAVITPHVSLEHAPDRATLTFVIDAGTRTTYGTIAIQGNAGVTERQLLDALGLAPGGPYESDRLAARIAEYVQNRRNAGYFEARLTPAVQLADDDRTANVTLTAIAGPRVRVVFRGDPLPADRRDALVPIAREGSADEDLLEDATNGIEDYLHAQGYRDATAPHAREEMDGELVITFTIKRGPQYRVADVELTGVTAFSVAELQSRQRLKKGQPFASALLEADLTAFEDLYHRLGFASARAQPMIEPVAGASPESMQVPVLVRIAITENVQTIVQTVRVEGNASVPEDGLVADLGLKPGQPFFLTQMAIDRDAIQLQYANLGYPGATVDSRPGLSADGKDANVVFAVREGPRIFVDHLLIVGNTRTATATIAREVQIRSGEPLGLEKISESQRRLAALGLFRRTRITELTHGDETTRDVLVSVEESPATTVGEGGGLEVGQRVRSNQSTNGVASERIEIAPRAFFEIGRRNLFGKNRSVNLFTRISLRPSDQTSNGTSSSSYGFSEYRILGTFREPRAFGTAADAFLTTTFEQQIRTSFNFARRAFSAEAARRITTRVSASGSYQIQRTELFDEKIDESDKLLVDRLFPQVRLSSFSLSAVRDTRDDALNPGEGHLFSANAQLAARKIGSEVGFAKSFFTAQLFRTLPGTSQIVFAGNARLGVASGFPRTALATDSEGRPIRGPDGQPVIEDIRDLPASERFFAGGDTTVRGYAIDQLGTPETIDKNGFPIGGNALVIFNAELRVPVRGGLGLRGFVDTGNVFAKTADIDLGQLRSSVGFGVRYRSPVGPIRIDLGFKIRRRDLVPGKPESRREIHISLGEAF
jgi:outer membrane protein insertion porin family